MGIDFSEVPNIFTIQIPIDDDWTNYISGGIPAQTLHILWVLRTQSRYSMLIF